MRSEWADALGEMCFRHIDPTSRARFTLLGDGDALRLQLDVDDARDTRNQDRRMPELTVHTFNLRIWPGRTLAQTWLAAAWACFFCHEAMELVTVRGEQAFSPHQAPYIYDQALRRGLPVDLTLDSLRTTLELVMGPDNAARLVAQEHEHGNA